ncbi:MAG: hypothetical protein J3Q66DRAFT_327371 [Benniella sp.]|nr:MAG: hypothetical protein J3Q66DRAFT_327371 [Benniella sp.]
MVVSFISFHDLTSDAHYLWASSTVSDALGYEPDELVGKCGYDIVYPEDHAHGKEFHKESFINDMVASQLIVRYKAKDGQPVPCLCVISLCYDFLVNGVTVLDHTAEAYLKLRTHSSVMTSRVGSKKEGANQWTLVNRYNPQWTDTQIDSDSTGVRENEAPPRCLYSKLMGS